MKRIKLTLTSVSICLLTLSLLLGGGSLWAKSQSGTFEMTSDVLSGTGGKAQSATFTLKASAGAQSSPIGSQVSTNFEGYGGWVYTLTPEFVRGDANGDCVLDVGDVVYLINFLFKYGPQPCPKAAGDENCDGNVDVGDVVYLINYLFKGGPHPCPGDVGEEPQVRFSKLVGSSGHARLSLLLIAESKGGGENGAFKISPNDQTGICEIAVMGKFDREVAGVQLEMEFDPTAVELLDPTLTPFSQNLQIYYGTAIGSQKIGILDLTGENRLPAGEGAIVNIHARGRNLNSIKIIEAVLVDKDARSMLVELSNELKREEVENSSTPDKFSLSQNFPNPFNPRTSIRYALPSDAKVKLVIYNVLGQKIKTLVEGHQTAGYNTVWWDGNDENGDQVASGIYFYRLEAGKFNEVKKMMLLK